MGPNEIMLRQIFDTIQNKDSEMDDLMDARSNLGITLHLYCLKDAKSTIKYIGDMLNTIQPASGISACIIISFGYALNYIPFNQRQEIIKQYEYPIIGHTTLPESQHMASIVNYLQIDSSFIELSKEFLLNGLLLLYDLGHVCCLKAISTLFRKKNLSHVFWNWMKSKEEKDIRTLQFMTLFADVVSTCNLEPGDPEILKKLNEITVELSSPYNIFAIIESSLVVHKWLVSVQKIKPLVTPNYRQPSLNALAIQCWSEYALTGDLNQIPWFEYSNDPVVIKAYANVIRSICLNPSLVNLTPSQIKAIAVPHWLWNAIKAEFFEGIFEEYSIKTLSISEFDSAIDISHLLPGWFFVQAIRLRTKNLDMAKRQLILVAETPRVVLESYLDDFYEFLTYILKSYNSLSQLLAECLQSMAIKMRAHISKIIILIISGINYYDTSNISSRLTVLSPLVQISRDSEYVLDVFACVWESLHVNEFSLSYLIAVFKFFTAIAPLVPESHSQLSGLATAALFGMFQDNIIQMRGLAEKLYNSLKRFYAIKVSDIINNPRYLSKDSYGLTPEALLLLSRLEQQDTTYTPLLLISLTKTLPICPTETAAVILHMFDLARKYSVDQMLCDSLLDVLKWHNEIGFVTIVLKMIKKGFLKIPEERGQLTSQIDQMPETIGETRLVLELDDMLMPLMVQYPSRLFLLYENQRRVPTDIFMNALSKECIKSEPKKARKIREFLDAYGYSQPPFPKEINGWLQRDFESYELFGDIGSFPTQSNLEFIRAYKNSKQTVHKVNVILKRNLDDLMKECGEKMWFIRLLIENNIKFKIPENTKDQRIRAIGIRRHDLKMPTTVDKEWMVPEMLVYRERSSMTAVAELAQHLQSRSLGVMFRAGGGDDIQYALDRGDDAFLARAFLNTASHLELTNDSEFIQYLKVNSSLVEKAVARSDIQNPIVFRAILTLLASCVTANAEMQPFMNVLFERKFNVKNMYTAQIVDMSPLIDSLSEIMKYDLKEQL